METTKAVAGGTIISPADYKLEFHKKLQTLRTKCENSNAWTVIRPVLDDLSGSFDNFIESLNT